MYRKPKQQLQAIQKEIPKVQKWMQTNLKLLKNQKQQFQDSQKFNSNKKKPESFSNIYIYI